MRSFPFLRFVDKFTSKKLGEDAFIKLSCVASTCFRCFSLKGKKTPKRRRIWQASHLFRKRGSLSQLYQPFHQCVSEVVPYCMIYLADTFTIKTQLGITYPRCLHVGNIYHTCFPLNVAMFLFHVGK